jgi:hypothetical protein
MRVAEIAKHQQRNDSQNNVQHGTLFSQQLQQFVQLRQMYAWQHWYLLMSPCNALFRR